MVDYFDQNGKRRHETFTRKTDAERREAQIRLDIGDGKLVAVDGTVADAAHRWLGYLRGEARARDAGPVHILPVLGSMKLTKLNHVTLEKFRTHLLD